MLDAIGREHLGLARVHVDRHGDQHRVLRVAQALGDAGDRCSATGSACSSCAIAVRQSDASHSSGAVSTAAMGEECRSWTVEWGPMRHPLRVSATACRCSPSRARSWSPCSRRRIWRSRVASLRGDARGARLARGHRARASSPPAAEAAAGAPPAEEAWADEVCASIASWRAEVETIATRRGRRDHRSRGATRSDRRGGGRRAGSRRRTTLRRRAAQQLSRRTRRKETRRDAAVDAFLDNVQQSDDEVRTAIAGLPENAGLAEIVAELSGLATSLQQTVESGRTLVSDIQALGSALRDGFENADSYPPKRAAEI